MSGVAVASIRADDAVELPFEPAAVFAVLIDFRDYDAWWPWYLEVEVVEVAAGTRQASVESPSHPAIGTRLRIRPLAGYDFDWRVEDLVADRSLRLRYEGGPYAGTGEWVLEAIPGGTRVHFVVDATTSHAVLGQLGQVLDLGLGHSLVMRGVLAGLARALAARHPRVNGAAEPRIAERAESPAVTRE